MLSIWAFDIFLKTRADELEALHRARRTDCRMGGYRIRNERHGGLYCASAVLPSGTGMMHVNPVGERTDAPPVPDLVTEFRDLYILSSAAAQLGGYGLEVPELRWRALAERTERARTVLLREPVPETDTVAALRRLLDLCEYIIELYIAGRQCPSAVWREAGKLGRDAYGYIDPRVNAKRGPVV
ncbi:hypothetical protein SB861_51070 [Paraburkholderia sp. SIMBA_049]